nr:ABC transporter permease [Lachnospiraceae bacterium]
MNILHKYTKENLKKNRSRTIVTIIGIILSMTLFTAVIEGAYSGREYFKNTVIATEGCFHTVFKDLNKEQAEGVIHDKDVDKVEYTQEVGYGIINSKNVDKPYLRVVTASENLDKLLRIELIKGRMPKNESEIVLPMHLQDNGGVEVKVGQTIDIDLGKRYLKGKELTSSYGYFNNKEDGTEELSYLSHHKYKVVGIIERLDRNVEEPLCPG